MLPETATTSRCFCEERKNRTFFFSCVAKSWTDFCDTLDTRGGRSTHRLVPRKTSTRLPDERKSEDIPRPNLHSRKKGGKRRLPRRLYSRRSPARQQGHRRRHRRWHERQRRWQGGQPDQRQPVSLRLLRNARILDGQARRQQGDDDAQQLALQPGAGALRFGQGAGDDLFHDHSQVTDGAPFPCGRQPHLPLSRQQAGAADQRPSHLDQQRSRLSESRAGHRHASGDRLPPDADAAGRYLFPQHRRRA